MTVEPQTSRMYGNEGRVMPEPTVQELRQQIAERERELQVLRESLRSRQHELTGLASRKERLQAELHQVEAEIATLSSTPRHPHQTPPGQSAVAGNGTAATRADGRLHLFELVAALLLLALRHSGGSHDKEKS